MKKEEFKKGIDEFKAMGLTEREKRGMLENIFKTPIESPFYKRFEFSTFFHRTRALTALLLIVMISSSALAYTAEKSVPGEALYGIKSQVFEPILNQVNTSPIEKLEWEEEKIERRLMEAEDLAEKGKLDEKKTRELEKKIEKSSAAFAVAAGEVASSTATTTSGRTEKRELLKKALRDKLEEKKGEKEGKLKRLKESAVKALDK